MSHQRRILHLTLKTIFPYATAPYAIYHHQVDGDHVNNIHDHDFIELVVISSGSGTQVTPFGDVALGEGSLFVMQPGVWHEYVDCDAMLVNVCAINCRLFDIEMAWLREIAPVRYLLWDAAMTTQQPGITHPLSPEQVNARDGCSSRCRRLKTGARRRRECSKSAS